MKTLCMGVPLLLLFNAAIAMLLTVVGYGMGFGVNLLFSQCIGCTVAAVHWLLHRRLPLGGRRWLTLALTLPASVFAGVALAYLLHGVHPATSSGPALWQSVLIGLIFAVIGCTVFALAGRIHTLDSELRQKKLDEAERERRELQAQLKMLQAQIEPHFLFNTLANVAGLIESDPAQARHLLERLISWLRLALACARSESATLGDELELLDHWLQILSLRYGPRLRWRFDVSQEARELVFPPMLLQPLVENAVLHGIEPKLGGGRLDVTARLRQDRLMLEVRDNGVGLRGATVAGEGVGIGNVRARLVALYGEKAGLTLTGNAGGGVTVTLDLPCVP